MEEVEEEEVILIEEVMLIEVVEAEAFKTETLLQDQILEEILVTTKEEMMRSQDQAEEEVNRCQDNRINKKIGETSRRGTLEKQGQLLEEMESQ